MYYQRALSELDPDYDDCPMYCGDARLRPVKDCRDCPHRLATDTFKEGTRELLTERIFRANRKSRWSLEQLIRTVEAIAGMAAKDDAREKRMTTATRSLVSIFAYEQTKMRRVDDWNEKQSSVVSGQ